MSKTPIKKMEYKSLCNYIEMYNDISMEFSGSAYDEEDYFFDDEVEENLHKYKEEYDRRIGCLWGDFNSDQESPPNLRWIENK
jgi:hypothetical protein